MTFHAFLDIWLSAVFCSHVPFEVTGLYTREDALITFEIYLSSVPALVFLEVTCISAQIITLVTLVWLLSSVLTLVCFQTTRLSRRIITLITFEWLLT